MSKITIPYHSMTDQQRFDLLAVCAAEGLHCTLRGNVSGQETVIDSGDTRQSRSVIEVVRFIQREGLCGEQIDKIGDTYAAATILPNRPYHPPQVDAGMDYVLRNIKVMDPEG